MTTEDGKEEIGNMLEIQSMKNTALCEMVRESKKYHPLQQKPMQFPRKMFN